MTTIENAATLARDNGLQRKGAIVEAFDNSLSLIIQHFPTKNSIFLASHTVNLGGTAKTFVAAIYFRPPIERDVSTTLIPNPRHDATGHSKAILNKYANDFPNVDSIYFTLDGLGHVLSADNGVRTEKLFIQQNPIEPLLEEKMAQVMNNLRNNKGI